MSTTDQALNAALAQSSAGANTGIWGDIIGTAANTAIGIGGAFANKELGLNQPEPRQQPQPTAPVMNPQYTANSRMPAWLLPAGLVAGGVAILFLSIKR